MRSMAYIYHLHCFVCVMCCQPLQVRERRGGKVMGRDMREGLGGEKMGRKGKVMGSKMRKGWGGKGR